MKNLIRSIIIGTDGRVSAAIALAFVLLVAVGCTCGKNFDLANAVKNANSAETSSDTSSDDADTGDMPDERLIKATVKLTTAQFANAISTGDFSKIYADASSDFKSSYTEDQMREVFKDSIANKRRLMPVLAKIVSIDPTFSPEPYMRTEQGLPILVVTGEYDVKPVPVKFTYEYVKRNGQFKLLKLLLS